MSARAGASALALTLVLAVTACGAGGRSAARTTLQRSPPKLHGATVLPDSVALDFTLRDVYGNAVQLSAQRGRVVVLTFLYTRCRDVCPLIAENLNSVLRRLGSSRSEVSVIAVSVDPVGDTRQAVRAYIRLHRLLPQFHYLVGTAAELRPVWQAYNVLSIARNLETIDHSAPTLLLDRRGRPRAYFPASLRAADVLHDVRALLGAPAG